MANPGIGTDAPPLVRASQLTSFIRAFAAINTDPKLFPKECRTCNRVFRTFAEYLRETIPKGHVLEDCSDVMSRTYTMVYRHCPCGNTLVLSVTGEVMPELDDFWAAVKDESEQTGKTVREIVMAFTEACDDFIINGREPADAGGDR